MYQKLPVLNTHSLEHQVAPLIITFIQTNECYRITVGKRELYIYLLTFNEAILYLKHI